jgi:hypothetical protein
LRGNPHARACGSKEPPPQLTRSASSGTSPDYLTGGGLDFETAPGSGTFTRETSRTVTSSFTQWQLRLEMKL